MSNHTPGLRTVIHHDLLAALQDFTTWHANHFEDFSSEINAELLCLANDAAAAIARTKAALAT